MIVYVLVLASSVSLAVWTQFWTKTDVGLFPRRVNFGAVAVFLILAGVSALRWQVGTDYWAYDRNFDTYVAEFETGVGILGEPGIRTMAWLSHAIGAGSAGMFALAAVITVGLIVRTLWRWSVAFGFSVAVFILAGEWHGSFNGVRQYVAAAILFAGHRYVIERKFLKWLLVVLVATLFHTSAVVGLLMYAIPRKKLSFPLQIVIVVLAIIALMGTGQILEFFGSVSEDPQVWGSDYAMRAVNPLRVAFECLPLILFWILPTQNRLVQERDWFYVNMLLIIAVTAIAGAGSAYMTRFIIYPSLFLPLSLGLITSLENKNERTLIRVGLLLIMAVFMFLEVSGSENLNNFQWIFDRE